MATALAVAGIVSALASGAATVYSGQQQKKATEAAAEEQKTEAEKQANLASSQAPEQTRTVRKDRTANIARNAISGMSQAIGAGEGGLTGGGL